MLSEGGDRFRVAKIGDADVYLSSGTHVFEIRYSIPGVLDPGALGSDKTFAGGDGRAVHITVGVLLERHRTVGTTGSNGPTSRSPCPATQAACSARSATASGGTAAT